MVYDKQTQMPQVIPLSKNEECPPFIQMAVNQGQCAIMTVLKKLKADLPAGWIDKLFIKTPQSGMAEPR
jgi:hypothetical protein